MYYRRTFTCNKDVSPAEAAGSATPRWRSLWLAVALFSLLMLIGPGLVAQPVSIEIERQHNADLGSIATVDITLTSTPSWFEMAGFDLLLCYDTLRL